EFVREERLDHDGAELAVARDERDADDGRAGPQLFVGRLDRASLIQGVGDEPRAEHRALALEPLVRDEGQAFFVTALEVDSEPLRAEEVDDRVLQEDEETLGLRELVKVAAREEHAGQLRVLSLEERGPRLELSNAGPEAEVTLVCAHVSASRVASEALAPSIHWTFRRKSTRSIGLVTKSSHPASKAAST